MNLTPDQVTALAKVARREITELGTLTISAHDDAELFQTALCSMSDEAIITLALEYNHPSMPRTGVTDTAPNPLISRWVADGNAAKRAGADRTSGPVGRKGQHWLVGWDQANADSSAAWDDISTGAVAVVVGTNTPEHI